jgi:hypothetical protein
LLALNFAEVVKRPQRKAKLMELTADLYEAFGRVQSEIVAAWPAQASTRALLKGRHIGAAWNVDHQRTVATRPTIVAAQRLAEPPGLHAHNRIVLGIEIAAAAERLDSNRVGLDQVGPASQCLFHDKGEKAWETERTAKCRAADDVDEVRTNLCGRWRSSLCLVCPVVPGAWIWSESNHCQRGIQFKRVMQK